MRNVSFRIAKYAFRFRRFWLLDGGAETGQSAYGWHQVSRANTSP